MPLYNGESFIERSLRPLLAMRDRGELREVLVVDDGSSDRSPVIAREMGATLMAAPGRAGPAAARNLAAAIARGGILWFVDADVVVHDDAAVVISRAFGHSPSAVFGSYDDRPPARNFLSQYKNLVHHYYHQRARHDASTFWSGCGAVDRALFQRLGGFDSDRFPYPSIEDIELGYRIRAAGGQVWLLPDLRCTHLKEWRLANLLHTEIFRRAIPWATLMLQRQALDNDLNVSKVERIKAVLSGFLLLSLLVSILEPLFLIPALVSLAFSIHANRDLLRLFYRRNGFGFAAAGHLFHQFYYLYSSAAFVWAWIMVKTGLAG